MPSPRKQGEDRDKFISRCMSEIADEFPDTEQRYAVCISYADKTKTEMKKEDLFVLVPRKAENRGQFLKRCSSNPKMKAQFGDLKERLVFCLTSFNEYYKYWTKIEEFAEVPSDTNLGKCITKKKSQGLDYKDAYRECASSVVVQPGPINMSDDLLVEPVMFADVVSIDFDDTLSTPRGQQLAEEMLNDGIDLHIVTRRNESESADVYKIAEELGIPKNKIHFTNGKLKWETIKRLGITEHIDNNPDEIEAIKKNLPDVKAIKFGLDEACWEGYEAIGMKEVGGRLVPNCVPIKED